MLVVDDEPEIVATIVEILEAEGHLVDTASSGATALDRVAGHEYDVVFSDLRMPDLDGPSLFERLTQERPALAERMIIVTGDTLSADARIFLERTRPFMSGKTVHPRRRPPGRGGSAGLGR